MDAALVAAGYSGTLLVRAEAPKFDLLDVKAASIVIRKDRR